MSATLYLEGGGSSKQLHTLCREGFRKLLAKCGFAGRMPRLVACGSRGEAFSDFTTAHHTRSKPAYVAMLIDSEDPLSDVEATWLHLARRDGWSKPASADDEQVLLMTTCMETWIIADRDALSRHYGSLLQSSALPPLVDLESRPRDIVQSDLAHATRHTKKAYTKGKRSFEILARLTPDTLQQHLPSFARVRRVLQKRL